MASLSELEPIAKIGRYDILGRLATGGMAEIFLAREPGPKGAARHIVVKRILAHIAHDERMVEMFESEASLCMNLAHPNICPIYEYGEQAGSLFLAMEWVRGVSLRELMDRAGRLPLELAVKVCADIAGALHHAHTCTDARGNPLAIVHRDVNPENVMIGFDGVPKLLDFGVAKASVDRKHKTEAGNLKGKFAYISPEQYQGQPIDGRSDVFSLGVTLYEAITGEPLYDRDSEYETVAAIVLDPDIPSLRAKNPDVPPELDVIVQMALAKDRDERYRSADELQSALTTFAAREGWHIRNADVAVTLKRLVPDLVSAPPALDRSASSTSGGWPGAPSSERVRDPEVDALLLASADEDMDALLAKRRPGRMLGWISALVIVVSLAIIGWVVLRPREGRAPAPTAPTPVETSRPTS